MKKIGILILLSMVLLTVACGPVKPTEDASVVETAEAKLLVTSTVELPLNSALIVESDWNNSKITSTIKSGDINISVVIKQRGNEFTYEAQGSVAKTTVKADIDFDGISYDHYRRGIDPTGTVKIKGDITKVVDGKKEYLYLKDVEMDKSGNVTGEAWYTTPAGKTVRVKASSIF